jgi:plastocyanin
MEPLLRGVNRYIAVSMRTPRVLFAALAGAAALLAAPAAVAENQSVATTSADTWSPAKVAVKPGETVTFTNNGGEHNVVWNDGKVAPMPAESVDPSQWPAGGVTRTFDRAGKFRYYCALHGDATEDFGMVGYVYVNSAGELPPTVTRLKASATRTKATLKFRVSRAGKAKAHFYRKSKGAFRSRGSVTFPVAAGAVTKRVTKAFATGSWRVNVVVTDAVGLKSDVATKTFRVS